jgi:UDP-3-O-[3-hydroxymyristoyl] glucosamine N-acyltransferase
MEFELAELARLLGGRLSDPAKGTVRVNDIKSLDGAGPSDLAILWDPEFAGAATATTAACVVTSDPIPGQTCLIVADPQKAMLAIVGKVYARRHPGPPKGVHPTAFLDPTVVRGEGVSVGSNATVEAGTRLGDRAQVRANAYVGRHVQIGADSVIHPNAVVHDHCRIGERTTIWSGAVIGKDGFGFIPNSGHRSDLSQGSTRIPQIGSVVIGNDVEIGALSTVARGALEDTVIDDGVIVDDQCQIAHGCKVQRNTVVVGRAALSGAVEVGRDTYLLQGCAIGQGRKIGDRAVVGSGAMVLYDDVGNEEYVLGWPARPAMREKRLQITLDRLIDQFPELRRRVGAIEETLSGLGRRPDGT